MFPSKGVGYWGRGRHGPLSGQGLGLTDVWEGKRSLTGEYDERPLFRHPDHPEYICGRGPLEFRVPRSMVVQFSRGGVSMGGDFPRTGEGSVSSTFGPQLALRNKGNSVGSSETGLI